MNNHVPYIETQYLDSVFDMNQFLKLITKAVRKLKKHEKQFDTLVFRGTSGMMMGPILAVKLKKQMLVVRKPGQAHNNSILEGNIGLKRYVIVDDFIDSGTTLKTIIDTIQNSPYGTDDAVCVGLLCYKATQEQLDGEPDGIYGMTVANLLARIMPAKEFVIGLKPHPCKNR